MDAAAAIDRKLHRIVLSSNKAKYQSGAALSRAIADHEYVEFSYTRGGKENFCDWETVRSYISFAQEVGILAPDFGAAAPKSRLQSLSAFRGWSGDLLLQFAKANGFGVDKLEAAVTRLVKEKQQFPTTRSLYAELKITTVGEQTFRWALTLQSLLRPATLGLCRRWLWVPANTFEY